MMMKSWKHLCFLLLFGVANVVAADGFSSAHADDNTVHLISSELPGGQLTKEKGGNLIGAFPSFFRGVSAHAEVPFDLRVVPWARAVRETERSDSLLMFPLSRTPSREDRFTWVAPVNEDRLCFVSVGKAVNSLEEGRKLKRVLVWRGTSHQAYLEQQKFKNLIVVSSKDRIIEIMTAAPEAAWYFMCDEAQGYLDPTRKNIALNIGKSIASEVTWLAGGKSFKQTPNTDRFVNSLGILKDQKVLKNLLVEFGK